MEKNYYCNLKLEIILCPELAILIYLLSEAINSFSRLGPN